MGLTRPPLQPVKTLSEWEKARAVLLAVDSEISKSFSLNRKINTANSSESVNQRNQQVADLLNDAICEPSDTAEDTEDPDSASNVSEKSKEEYGCQDGELDLVTRERMFDHLEIAHDFISLVSSLSRYVDVMVLVRTSREDDLEIRRLIDDLRAFDSAKGLLASPHVFFVPAPFDTKWIRDYGPLFVRDPSGAVICVDTRYDPDSTSEQNQLKELAAWARRLGRRAGTDVDASSGSDSSTSEERDSRIHDDQAPTILASRFRQRDAGKLRRYPVSVVRPPIVLAGGDFLTDGLGTAFTSTRTLRDNGGNVEMLDLNFKKYLGIDNVVYLHPLPGQTVKHIDMFLQVAAPNVLLLGKFSRPALASAEARLQSAAYAAMEDNLTIIRDYYLHLGKTVRVIDEDSFALDTKSVNIVRVPCQPSFVPSLLSLRVWSRNTIPRRRMPLSIRFAFDC